MEEIRKLITYATEQECKLIRQGAYFQDWALNLEDPQDHVVLIPSSDPSSANFMGCLAREIQKFTNPK